MPGRYLGVELGSTRIKAVLVNDTGQVLATGSHIWENQLVDGYWSYPLEAAMLGLQEAYAQLASDFADKQGGELTSLDGIGISAMMHGYLAFSVDNELLVPFRTWRNTTTAKASDLLTSELAFTMPQRWSVVHLCQAVLNSEEHVANITHLTTLAGYVHWRLTGLKVLGVGDASGMFPIDGSTWDQIRLTKTQAWLDDHGCNVHLADVLPEVRCAGQSAGTLTTEGALLLDPTGRLSSGVAFCPPEGDAGTGMVATNAVAPRRGNISAGTSIFAMVVLERELAHLHPEIDMVTTPSGNPVAMVHCNNGASEIDAWVRVFGQFAEAVGQPIDTSKLFDVLFGQALNGDVSGGGLLAYNYLSGEPVTGLLAGRPLIVRTPESQLNLPNLMRTLLMSSFGTLSLGMQILAGEGVQVDAMFAHGGIFATEAVAQRLLAAAIGAPVTVGRTAAEGGAWGMAVLAAYMVWQTSGPRGSETLSDYLAKTVFASAQVTTVSPDPTDQTGYAIFLDGYKKGLAIQKVAIEVC